MRLFPRAFWSVVLVMIAIITGTALGAGLGWLDVLFLTGRVSFAQSVAYQSAVRLLVRYLPITINALAGSLFGALAGIVLLRSTSAHGAGHRVFAGAFQGFILGGITGALLGYADLAVLSQYLNLASSDNASAWRENRSFLVMINAAFGSAVGLLLGMGMNRRR